GIDTKFIELAGEINVFMPHYVVDHLEKALGGSLQGKNILLLGAAYKKNVADTRESPAFSIMEILKEKGAMFDYHDPHVAQIPNLREHPQFVGMQSVALRREKVSSYDAVVVVTDHQGVDYALVGDAAKLVVDT